MKREIKFRGKIMYSGHGNGFIYGYLFIENQKTMIRWTHNPITNDYTDIEVKPETVGQFTGLTDKNGVEIYEGDIVKYDNETKAKVIFKEGAFCGYDGYAMSSDEAYLLLSCDDNLFRGHDFEVVVIGNIHLNPELL